jgi:hydroxymethylglutaryl-CoA lyase
MERVTLREVGMRDGLQAEDRTLSTEAKLELLTALSRCGIERLEVTSFVHPRAIPQLADAEDLLARAEKPAGQIWSALVPNARGAERAAAAPQIDEWTFFLSASEEHNQANVRRSVAESLQEAEAVAERARAAGRAISGVVATSFVCPYAGETPVDSVVRVARRLYELGYPTLLFGDTIGAAAPHMVRRLVRALQDELGEGARLGLHFHNTRGQAPANALAGAAEGIRLFDGSVGGMGGCPYAPGATGNVATEDLAWLFQAEGFETGADLAALAGAALRAEQLVGRRLPGSVMRTFEEGACAS